MQTKLEINQIFFSKWQLHPKNSGSRVGLGCGFDLSWIDTRSAGLEKNLYLFGGAFGNAVGLLISELISA